MGADVRIVGMEGRAALYGAQVESIVRAALREAAGEVVLIAKALAPVDTGTLRDSIHVEEGEDGGVAIVADPVQDRAPDGYAAFVEFGTGRNPAQPFMTPAAEEGSRLLAGIIERKMRAGGL